MGWEGAVDEYYYYEDSVDLWNDEDDNDGYYYDQTYHDYHYSFRYNSRRARKPSTPTEFPLSPPPRYSKTQRGVGGVVGGGWCGWCCGGRLFRRLFRLLLFGAAMCVICLPSPPSALFDNGESSYGRRQRGEMFSEASPKRHIPVEPGEDFLYFNAVQKTGSTTFVKLFRNLSSINGFKFGHDQSHYRGNYSRQLTLDVQVRG